jgi:DNA-binding response OmpR family regulator
VKQVLVVDDSHVIRRLVEVVLGQIEIEVVAVSSGSQACEALESMTPDVVILDVGLPDMPGWDVLDFLRCRPDLVGTSVIMLTGRSDAEDIERAADKGANEYLLKPFRPDELRRLVVRSIHGTAQTAF